MAEKRFDVTKLNKLNDPERLKDFPAEIILSLVNLENPQIIIDLGAGTGFFSISFSKLLKNCKIYACDISDIMINWMNENVTNQFNNILPLKMKDSNIPLSNEIADLLFMVNLHHELSNPIETLKECFRLLKPTGKIVISDWKKEISNRGPSFNLRYEPENVEMQLKETGFQVQSVLNHFPNNFLIIGVKL